MGAWSVCFSFFVRKKNYSRRRRVLVWWQFFFLSYFVVVAPRQIDRHGSVAADVKAVEGKLRTPCQDVRQLARARFGDAETAHPVPPFADCGKEHTVHLSFDKLVFQRSAVDLLHAPLHARGEHPIVSVHQAVACRVRQTLPSAKEFRERTRHFCCVWD